MGRKNHGGNLRMRVQQDGSRQAFVANHDDRSAGYSRGGGNGNGGGGGGNGGGGRGSHNRVWRSDGSHHNSQGSQFYKKSVSFVGGGGGIKKRLGPRGGGAGGGPGVNLRNFALADDDVGMGGSGPADQRGGDGGFQAGRARMRGNFKTRGQYRGGSYRGNGPRGGGGRGGAGGFNHARIVRGLGGTGPASKSWHKVTVAGGAKYDTMELLGTMLTASTTPFAPICYVKVGINTTFYVETTEMATSLKNINQNVTLSDGMKLSLQVTTSPPPTMTLTEDVIEQVKVVLGQRYRDHSKALDLQKFHSDNAFLGKPLYAALARSQLFKEVVRLIGAHAPMIEALEMSDNRINTLDGFQELTERAPAVTILFLANNNLREVAELKKVKGWKLKNLKLTGNPLVTKFEDTTTYQTEVRKILPSLETLDDVQLPPMISFDDDDDASATLPAPVPKLSVATPAQEEVVTQFVTAYLGIYDSDNRQALLQAYHEDALLSMTVAYPPNSMGRGLNLNAYLPESRNLLRLAPGDNRRARCLRQGSLAAVSFLNDLPKTEHDKHSFTLDITLASDNVMAFSITGLFREREGPASGNRPVRHFSRVFVIMRAGEGWNVVNETIFVTHPTNLQLKNSFTGVAPVQPTVTAAPVQQALTEYAMMEMMNQLSARTNMTLEFTKECLDNTGWNLERAFEAFQRANQENKIPANAFKTF